MSTIDMQPRLPSAEFTVEPAELLKQKIVVLMGPDNPGHLALLTGLQKQNPLAEITQIGDGLRDISSQDISQLHREIANSEDRPLLVMVTHGDVVDNQHKIQLKVSHDATDGVLWATDTIELFQSIAEKLSGRPIDIFMFACHGGEIIQHLDKALPIGSNVVGLSPANMGSYVSDGKRFCDVLNSNETIINGKVTAKNLLKTYLMQALQNDVPPFLNTTRVPTMLRDDREYWWSGIHFTQEEVENIHDQLDKFDGRSYPYGLLNPQLDTAINIMKRPCNELAGLPYLYGPGLAALHVARGELGKTSLAEGSRFSPRIYTNFALGDKELNLKYINNRGNTMRSVGSSGISTMPVNLDNFVGDYFKLVSEDKENSPELQQLSQKLRSLSYDILRNENYNFSNLDSKQLNHLITNSDTHVVGSQRSEITPSLLRLMLIKVGRDDSNLVAQMAEINKQHEQGNSENVKKLQSLSGELDAFRQDIYNQLNDIGATQTKDIMEQRQRYQKIQSNLNAINQQLNNENKIRSTEIKRQEYDQRFRNVDDVTSILSCVSVLTVNNRLANQITVAGAAATKISRIIAGLAGNGVLAGISPLSAGAGIMSALTSVISLFGHHKDNSMQVMMQALQGLAVQLHEFRLEAREYFEKILQTLGSMESKMLLNFAEMHNDITQLRQEVGVMYQQLSGYHQQHQFDLATVHAEVKSLRQTAASDKIKYKLEKMLRITEVGTLYPLRSKESVNEAVRLNTKILSEIIGETGVKSADLVGTISSNEHFIQHPAELTSQLGAYPWPISPINTLYHLQQQKNFVNDRYTLAMMDYILRKQLEMTSQQLESSISAGFADESERINQITIAATHEPAHLIMGEKSDSKLMSLYKTIKEYLASNPENNNCKKLFIPLLIHGQWQLVLVVPGKNPDIIYIGNKNERVIHILETFNKDADKDSQPFKKDISVISMPASENVNLSGNVLSWLAMLLYWPANARAWCDADDEVHRHANIRSRVRLSEHICDIVGSMPDDLQMSHKYNLSDCSTNLKYEDLVTKMPVNPPVWSYLVDQYLALSERVYGGNTEAHKALVTYEELASLQSILLDAENTREILFQLRDPKYFDHLLNEYFQSGKNLEFELSKHYQGFLDRKNQEMNTQFSGAMHELFRGQPYKILSEQTLPVKADFACSYKDGLPQTMTKWFDFQQVHKFGDGWYYRAQGYGSTVVNQLTAQYVKSQQDQFKAQINSYINSRELNKPLSLNVKLNLHAEGTSTKHTPAMAVPSQQNYPYLPMGTRFEYLIPSAIFEAQSLNLGHISYTYNVNETTKKFTLSINFDTPDSRILVANHEVTYDPLFYTGNEGVLHWWMGGYFPINVNQLSRSEGDDTPGGHYYFYWYSPVNCPQPQRGYLDQQNDIQALQIMPDAISKISQMIADKKKVIYQEWLAVISHITSNDSTSPLGIALETWEAKYHLLNAQLETALPYDHRITLHEIFSTLFTQDNQSCVYNKAGLIDFMSKVSTGQLPILQLTNLLHCSDDNAREIRYFIHELLSMANQRADHPILDATEKEIYRLLDTYTPCAVSELNAEDVKEVHPPLMNAGLEMMKRFMAINPGDVKAVEEMQRQFAQLLQATQTQTANPVRRNKSTLFQPASAIPSSNAAAINSVLDPHLSLDFTASK